MLLKDTHACFYPYYSATNIDRLVLSGFSQSKEQLSHRKVYKRNISSSKNFKIIQITTLRKLKVKFNIDF